MEILENSQQIINKTFNIIKDGDDMCTVGGPMADVKMKKLKTKRYRCLDCGNEFKGLGRKVVCPTCQSENVEEL